MSVRRHTAVHLAAPLDLRSLQDDSATDVDLDDAVAFALAMPAVEAEHGEDRVIRRSAREEWLSSETAPESRVPETALIMTPSQPDAAPRSQEPISAPVSSEPELPESREMFLAELAPLGTIAAQALVPQPGDRIEPTAVILGRARGLRFRLALLEAWPVDEQPRSVRARDPRFLDALLDAAVLVVFAGAQDLVASPYPTDAALLGGLARVAAMYAHRSLVRESGVAACARLTVLGPQHTLERLSASVAGLGPADRGSIGNAIGSLARLAGPSEPRGAMLLAIQRLLQL